MRRLNTALVLQAVMDEPVATIAAVIAATKLSRRTAEVILESLVESGWVIRLDELRSRTVGRPALRYQFAPGNGIVVAIHFNYLEVVAAVADISGEILHRAVVETPPEVSRNERILAARGAAAQALGQGGIPADRVRRVVISTPGTVDEDGVVALKLVPPRPVEHGGVPAARSMLHGWNDFSLADAFRADFDCPIDAENDVNLSALAEQWLGATRADADSVWLVAGTFVGAGIIINGEVYRGYRGRAGEFINATGLGMDRLTVHPLGALTGSDAQRQRAAIELLDRARGQEPDAVAQVEAFGRILGDAVVTLSWILSPSVIVLGLGLAEHSDLLLPTVRGILEADGPADVRVVTSALVSYPHNPALLGAVKLGIERLRAELLQPGGIGAPPAATGTSEQSSVRAAV